MNKTVTINLSGLVFYIDEQAYDKLRNYLQTIKSYFKNTEGGDDIIADIEGRVAELFQERTGPAKQAIMMNDVDAVIEIMGKPESFIDADELNEKKHDNFSKEENVNFTGKNRRVFRDPDDKVIGGVCSGLANYFGTDPIWIRLIFAIAFFGFGTGLLIYILLLIIIPKAKTTADKLEMRGEPVTISNIEKSVKEEMDDLKARMKDFGNDVKSGTAEFKSGNTPRSGIAGFIQQVVTLIAQLIKGFGKVIVKFIGGFLIFIGIVLLLILSGMFFGSDAILNITADGITRFSLPTLLDLIFISDQQIGFTKIGVLLLFGIPLIMVIFSGVKIIFKLKGNFRPLKAVALGLWTIGLIIGIYTITQITREYSQIKREKSLIGISNVEKTKILHLDLKQTIIGDDDNHDMVIGHENHFLVALDKENLVLGYPELDIIKNTRDSVELEVQRIARGSNKKEASVRANNIMYEYTQKDTAIVFSDFFKVPVKDKWRAQKLKLVLKIPVGQVIYLDDNLEDFIYDIDNVTDTWDKDMVGRRWKMTETGLACVDCDGTEKKIGRSSKRKNKIRINGNNSDDDNAGIYSNENEVDADETREDEDY